MHFRPSTAAFVPGRQVRLSTGSAAPAAASLRAAAANFALLYGKSQWKLQTGGRPLRWASICLHSPLRPGRGRLTGAWNRLGGLNVRVKERQSRGRCMCRPVRTGPPAVGQRRSMWKVCGRFAPFQHRTPPNKALRRAQAAAAHAIPPHTHLSRANNKPPHLQRPCPARGRPTTDGEGPCP
jgi:hypothetical protein